MSDAEMVQVVQELQESVAHLLEALNATLARGPDSPATSELPKYIEYFTGTAQPWLSEVMAAAQANDRLDPHVVQQLGELAALVPRYATGVRQAENALEQGVANPKTTPGVKASNFQEYLAYMDETMQFMVAEHQPEAIARLRNLVAATQNFKAMGAEEFAEIKEFENKTNNTLAMIKDYLKKIDTRISAISDDTTEEEIGNLGTREEVYKPLVDQLQDQLSQFTMWETKVGTETKEVASLLDGALANAQHSEHMGEAKIGLQSAMERLQDLTRMHQRLKDSEKFVKSHIANAIAQVGDQEPEETAILSA